MRNVKTPGGRRSRRLALLAGAGIAAAAIVGGVALTFQPRPLPTRTAPPSLGPVQSPAVVAEDGLPRPTTSYVVLLVGDPVALDQREMQWIGDLRRAYGRAELLAYRAATPAALAAYLTIFVIGESADLDASALGVAYSNGASIHLIGAAAGYRSAITGPRP